MRDMTKAQFIAALARNGFGRPVLGGWVTHQDFPHASWGLTLAPTRDGSWKLDKRASLAKVIADVKRERLKPSV